MKSESRTKLLTIELKKQRALARIWKNKDFQTYLLPELSIENKWIDPQTFDSDALFQRAYNTNWAKAQISKEIITLLEEADVRVIEINNRINPEIRKR